MNIKKGARPKGSKVISNKTYSTNNSNVYDSKKNKTIGKQGQNSNQREQNIIYDVPGDASCLFWSVATAYLLPVRNKNEEFKYRFIQLFGLLQVSCLSYVQNLLQQFDITNRNSTQDWYQDATANRLIRSVLRNRVVDYIQSNLDAIPISNGELTFRNIIPTESNYINIYDYSEQMRIPNPNPDAIQNSWGGTPEIYAISDILNCNINVTTSDILELQTNIQNTSNTINLFYVNNRTHYNFGLTPEDQPNHPSNIDDNQENILVVDTKNRIDNLPPTSSKSDEKTIKLTVGDHDQHNVILSNNNDDDDNQCNNIINVQEKR